MATNQNEEFVQYLCLVVDYSTNIFKNIRQNTCSEIAIKRKTISNDQELIQSDPTSCPQNQKGNN